MQAAGARTVSSKHIAVVVVDGILTTSLSGSTLLAFFLIFLIGALIGAVGVGGFLVVPILVFLDGRPVRDAVIAATVSFIGSGMVSLFVWLRERQDSTLPNRAFLLATAPGALLGALLVRVASGTTIGILVAAAVGLAGLGEIFRYPRANQRNCDPRRHSTNGLLTGIGSALTGTSGPLIAMPLLAWAGIPIVERIRISQVAQLPIAATAAIVFISAGDIAWTVAATSAVALAAGALVGMRLTTALPPLILSKTVAVIMLITAFSMLGSAFL